MQAILHVLNLISFSLQIRATFNASSMLIIFKAVIFLRRGGGRFKSFEVIPS